MTRVFFFSHSAHIPLDWILEGINTYQVFQLLVRRDYFTVVLKRGNRHVNAAVDHLTSFDLWGWRDEAAEFRLQLCEEPFHAHFLDFVFERLVSRHMAFVRREQVTFIDLLMPLVKLQVFLYILQNVVFLVDRL